MIRKHFILCICFALCSSFLLSACLKEESLPSDGLEQQQERFAGIAAFNGWGSKGRTQVRIDGRLFNTDTEFFDSGDYLAHRAVFPGTRQLDWTQTAQAGREDLSQEIQFQEGALYTLFFYGNHTPKVLVTEDNLVKPSPGFARFRVVNLVEGSPDKLQISLQGVPAEQIQFEDRIFQPDDLSLGARRVEFWVDGLDKIDLDYEPEQASVNTLVIYESVDMQTQKPSLAYRMISLK